MQGKKSKQYFTATEKPGLVEGVSAYGRGLELYGLFQPEPFCDSMIL